MKNRALGQDSKKKTILKLEATFLSKKKNKLYLTCAYLIAQSQAIGTMFGWNISMEKETLRKSNTIAL